MLNIKLQTFILLVNCSITSFSQVDSSLNFFPLNSGDLFHYKYLIPIVCGHRDTSYITMEVFEDTLLSTHYLYKKIKYYYSYNNFYDTKFFRADSSSIFQCVGDPPHDEMMEKLNVKPGETFVRENWRSTECNSVDTVFVLGLKTIVKKFHVYYYPGADYSLANGLGCIKYMTYTTDPCYPNLSTPVIMELVYARINGIEYGKPLFVNVKNEMVQPYYKLEQNYPNPFNPGTTIRYSLPKESDVTLRIFSVLGEEIVALVNENQAGGIHEAKWNAENYPAGIYFYQLKTNNGYFETKKMMLLK